MPSPRAVLADITDLKLDPNVPHYGDHIRTSGRLHVKSPASKDTKPVVVAEVVKPIETKEQPKKPTEKKVQAVVSEKPKQVEAVKVEPKVELKTPESKVETSKLDEPAVIETKVSEAPSKVDDNQITPPVTNVEDPKKEDVKLESVTEIVSSS